jgi:pimeloyl-ACP methyl ester carboxylesterase
VKLPYAHIRAESAHPHPDPLVYIVGGPGGSALAEFSQIYGWFRALRRDRDLILYDQRGTLLADPVLECALDGPPPTAAEIEQSSTRVPAHLHPLDANDVVIAHCAERLQAQGIDLAHYDTATHARDLLDLMAALGYQKVNLYGTSYGTRIALEVMRVSPNTLRAVVLDSVYPPTVNAYEIQHWRRWRAPLPFAPRIMRVMRPILTWLRALKSPCKNSTLRRSPCLSVGSHVLMVTTSTN